jgi:hypothetical protein
MNRLLLKALVPLTLAFTLLVVLTNARSHDDTALRDLLLPPEGCPAPCWQGIQPGVTPLYAAAALMEANDGIDRVARPYRYSGQLLGSPVSVLLMTHPGTRIENPVVESLRLRLADVTFGELQLALGPPERVISYIAPQHGYSPFVAAYPRYDLYVLVDMPACNLNQVSLWNTTRYVEIIVGNWMEYRSDYYLGSRDLDTRRWASELRSNLHCDEHGYAWIEASGVIGLPESH